jgi:hypothetical protein
MVARFSVPDEDVFALDKRLTTPIGERMTVMSFWPGVKRVEFHTERGEGIVTVEGSSRAIRGIGRACTWVGMDQIT